MSGCGGMLGEAFYEVFREDYVLKCSDIDLNSDWLELLDFRDLVEYRKQVESFAPDYLFHIGAFTDLEYCEKNIDETYSTNTISVENATFIANKLDIPLLYISTAGIFDGNQELYDDWDLPNPLCHYARSKYAGEKFVLKHSKYPLVLRAGWMMGGGPGKDKKFIAKILKQLKEGTKELNVVDDKLGTPTYTLDFASNTKLILEHEVWGLYNLVCQGVTGRYEVASKILSILNLEKEIKLNKVKSDFFEKEYFAPRPASERLVNKKLKLRNLDIMRDWETCLEEYLNKSFKNFL